MTRLGFLSAAMLGLAGLLAPAPVAAQDAAGVTGAAEATLPDGATFNGIPLRGLTLGQGLFIVQDGSATGQFQAVLLGTSLLGAAQNITVEGEVSGGSVGGGGGGPTHRPPPAGKGGRTPPPPAGALPNTAPGGSTRAGPPTGG